MADPFPFVPDRFLEFFHMEEVPYTADTAVTEK